MLWRGCGTDSPRQKFTQQAGETCDFNYGARNKSSNSKGLVSNMKKSPQLSAKSFDSLPELETISQSWGD